MESWSGVQGKRVVITGATGGIGLAAAVELARSGAQLTLVARNEERAAAAAAAIRGAAAAGGTVEWVLGDLSLQASVRALAAELLARHERIDALVNNAGAMFTRRRIGGDGIELTWALNHLAPFLLTELLLERLRASAPARIVTTSSDAHRGRELPLDDLAAERSYRARGFDRYGQTKLANILFTRELARRLEGSGVNATCFHPGLVASGFNRNNGPLASAAMLLARPLSRSPQHGARTLVWLLGEPATSVVSGGYYADERLVEPSAQAQDPQAARTLWERSREQVGL